MARPTKYNWNEIEQAYQCGMIKEKIVKKYGVTKKTLENKISAEKWEVTGEVKSAINELSDSLGRVSGVQEKFPEKAHIIAEEVEEKTKHLQFINNLTLKNLSVMGKKIDGETSINEHKMISETVDKSAITLGVADRHSNSGSQVTVNNQNSLQNNIAVSWE